MYTLPIKYALIFFPFIAFLITIPYMIYEYHKYGSISKLRTFIIYSFLLYLMVIYFLVILPLPTREYVSSLKTPWFNLIPFKFIYDFFKETSLNLKLPQTYLKCLTEPCFYVVVFNIFMTIPFGMYLRYYFKCSFKKTLLLTFFLSLFFEITQLTGLYFIYERPYRLADVDDLILNTLGGILGYLLAIILIKILPSRDKIDDTSFKKGEIVLPIRRLTMFFLDLGITLSTIIILEKFIKFKYLNLIIITIYYILIPFITKGYTIGSSLVKVKFKFTNNLLFGLIIRTIFYFIYLNLIFILSKLVNLFSINSFILIIIKIYILVKVLEFYLINFIILFKNKTIYYDNLIKIKYLSTIKIK